MTTTVLFIEHVFAGLQASIWFVLFVFSCFGYSWVDLDIIDRYETIIAVSALSIIYPLGIFIDNIADEIFKPWNRKIRQKKLKEAGIEGNIEVMKIVKDIKDDYCKKYIEYIRVRIRISRFTALNFLLISMNSIIFVFIRFRHIQNSHFWRIIVFEIIIGVAITIISAWNWYSISNLFAKRIISFIKP